MDAIIKSRRSIRPGTSGSCSPSHGSPIRRNAKHSSPNRNGSSDDDETSDRELAGLDNFHDVTASTNTTLNSSLDDADGESVQMKYSRTESRTEYSPGGSLRAFTVKQTKMSISKKKETNYGLLWLGLIVVVGAAAFIYFQTNFYRDDPRTRQQLRCSFKLFEHDFPKQNEILWKSLEHGVESVLNDIPTAPSIFLLAYEDADSANRITHSIVKRTIECMDSKVNALELSPADLAYNEMKSDYGIVIAKYQKQLKRSGVMLVNDVNKVPSEVAPALHVFCDVHNPLVDRSIIFLTLQLTRQIHSNSDLNALSMVENYLRSNWSGLQDNVLEPLIIRVTDQVFVLNKE